MHKENWVVPDYKIFKLKEKKTKYCLIIPVLNEGNRFFLQLDKVKIFYNKIDIIIADGGSSDDSVNLEILRKNNVS